MGKSKRKRKLKEDDFKKKKLKVGKRLPMPDNVTKTSFKARSINIVQHTKNQDGGGEEPVNFKHQTLKDLLSSCSHYNTQAREEALVGLKDLIEKHPGVLKENLNDIFQRVLGKITDIESTVRRAFLSLIWSSFRGLTEEEIAPFFPNVVAYLCSAMTHLNEGVRLDSMKFLDHCLRYYPRLLSNHSKNIILNFINVISSEKGDQGATKKVGIRKAKVNTSQKIQLQVLTRLNHLLQVILSVGCDGGYGDSSGGGSGYDGIGGGRSGDRKVGSTNTSSGSKLTVSNTTINFGTTSNGGIGTLLIPSGTKEVFTRNEVILVSDFSLKSSWAGSSDLHSSSVDLLRNEVKLMELIASLSPVLFEYWVECCPAEFAMNLIPVKKTTVSLQIMKEILEIFVTLIESLKKIISNQEVFSMFLKEKLFAHFYGHFVSVFPMSFTLQHSGSKKEKKDEGNQSISDVSMNLLICQLLSHFVHCAKQDDSNLPKWVIEVVHYLSEILVRKASGNNSQSPISLTDIKSLTQLVKVFIVSIPVRCDDLKVKLLKSMFQLHEATHVMSNTKKVLLQFLEDVLTTLNHYEISPSLKAILDDWLCSLLKIASNKDISSVVVHKVFSVCKLGILQMFPSIVTALIKVLPAIFRVENFKRFSEETQLLVIEVLYHLKQAPTRKRFEIFSILSNSGTLSLKVFQYLLQVLHQVSSPDVSNQEVHVSTAPDFLSFLLSVLVGRPEKKLAQLQTQKKSTKNFQHPLGKDNILVTEPKEYYSFIRADQDVETLKKDWEYQMSMTNIICQYLQLSDYSGTLLDVMAPSICKLFGQYRTLPLSVVYRLLCLVKTLLSLATENHNKDDGNDDDLMAYSAKWCALIWLFFFPLNSDSRHGEFFQAIMKDLKELLIKLCKISHGMLQNMLGLFLTYTSSTDNNCTLTCQVLTDMLKLLLKDVPNVCQKSVKRLYENLDHVFNAGMIDSQIFSDFKYQVSVFSNM